MSVLRPAIDRTRSVCGSLKKTRLLAMVACVALPVVSAHGFEEHKIVDLTHALDESTIAWPTARPFHREQTAWGITPAGYWYASGDVVTSEHAGTHIDAPVHFAQGQTSVDDIALDRLIGPAVVVDVRVACAQQSDYRLSVEDLHSWELRYGRIPDGAIVIMHTGWGRFWPDASKYLGSATPGDATTLHFPGFSAEAAEFLVRERKVDGIGIDTASIDHGPSREFAVHQVINGAGKYGLENIAYLDRLPASGAMLIALPMKIKGGSGGPVRIVAILP